MTTDFISIAIFLQHLSQMSDFVFICYPYRTCQQPVNLPVTCIDEDNCFTRLITTSSEPQTHQQLSTCSGNVRLQLSANDLSDDKKSDF